MSKFRSLAAALFTIGSLAGGANGAVLIEITESGSDLLFTTTGSLNISGLNNEGAYFNPIRVSVGSDNDNTAFSQGTQDYYGSGFAGVAYSNTFSTSSFSSSPTLVSGGADFGFRSSTAIWVPVGYVSGSSVSQVLRLSGASFASLGINVGEFSQLSWTTDGGDSIRMQAAIPEPSSVLLFGLAALGFSARRRR